VSVTIHNSLSDPSAARRFEGGVRQALEHAEGVFVVWLKTEGAGPAEVAIHMEEPDRKEALGNVVEGWKRSLRVAADASAEDVRRAVEKLRGA
jgi:hypothetical protein